MVSLVPPGGCYNRLDDERCIRAMIAAIVVALIGLGGIILGWMQLSSALPTVRRAGRFSAYMNIVVGIFLLALAALRYAKLL